MNSGKKMINRKSIRFSMSSTPVDPAIGITVLPERFRKATKQLATLVSHYDVFIYI